jgi:plastocyanin
MTGSRKLTAVLAALIVAMFTLAACGDDEDTDEGTVPGQSATSTTGAEETTSEQTTTESDSGKTGGAGGTIEVAADPEELAYTTGDLEAPAGEVTISFDNPANIGHDVRVSDESGADVGGTDVITADTTTATVELETGEYTYFCSIPGHQPAGMEGKLSVK